MIALGCVYTVGLADSLITLLLIYPYRIPRIAAPKPHILIPNPLKRQFTVSRPNEVWETDITYIRTLEGWLYLAVVLGPFSRRIVGLAVRPLIHRELVLETVKKAVRSRCPSAALIRSDQGSHFESDAWRRFCKG